MNAERSIKEVLSAKSATTHQNNKIQIIIHNALTRSGCFQILEYLCVYNERMGPKSKDEIMYYMH